MGKKKERHPDHVKSKCVFAAVLWRDPLQHLRSVVFSVARRTDVLSEVV